MDLLKGEDPAADLGLEDIEQVVEHHLDQYTIRVRHDRVIEGGNIVCAALPFESVFKDSTILEQCCFYKLSDATPFGHRTPVCHAAACSTIRERWDQLQSEVSEIHMASQV